MRQKAVWAGANNGSYPLAVEALKELADLRLAAKQVRRLTVQAGEARLAECDDAVEQLKAMSLPKRRAGSRACDPPGLAVISLDGGRYQRRDHFRGRNAPDEPVISLEAPKAEGKTHWRETKVGCLLSMESEVHASDPTPVFPHWLATSAAVAELAKVAEKAAISTRASPVEERVSPVQEVFYEPPKLIAREVIASSHDSERFGWDLEVRAWRLGFPAAKRQVVVADGAAVNWTIAQTHFPNATKILDLMHALAYAWSAANAVGDGELYPTWAKWIWEGEVRQVIDALTAHQSRLGKPPREAQASDPRCRLDRALTYYTNNQSRMNYPEYRQLGLPITSSHIESTIKQINRRIKGTEKFWRQDTGDAVLQLRADCLSDTRPLDTFWQRWHAQQTGANRYQSQTAA